MFLEESQAALEAHDVGVGVDDVLQPVGLAVLAGLLVRRALSNSLTY